eukprot:TRINITY_DN6675_c0_g1_i1.p1 TRINITY_DN6675_c0_g1~~TRINITY_DN6675_c0_g1_i1.p1  ORF type:complete len:356 (+),score=85.75 TRINITY_DN6675_c0_g1_i1:159-1226(+)
MSGSVETASPIKSAFPFSEASPNSMGLFYGSSWADEMDELDELSPAKAPEPTSGTEEAESKMRDLSVSERTPLSAERKEFKSSRFGRQDSFSPRRLDFKSDRGQSSARDYPTRDYRSSREYPSTRDSYAPRREDAATPLPTSAPFVAFANHLHPNATEEDITAFFKEDIKSAVSVKLAWERETNSPRGFCYVEFNDLEDLKTGLSMAGRNLLGKPIRIVVADTDRTPMAKPSSDAMPADSGSMKGKAIRQDAPSVQPPPRFDRPKYTDNRDFGYKSNNRNSYTSPMGSTWNVQKRRENPPAPSSYYRRSSDAPVRVNSNSAQAKKTFRPVDEAPKRMPVQNAGGNMFAALQDDYE